MNKSLKSEVVKFHYFYVTFIFVFVLISYFCNIINIMTEEKQVIDFVTIN